MPAPSDDITAIFRNSWSLYDLITARNYMYHQEIYAAVADLLRQRAPLGPYRILDLGCGNARFLAACLQAAPPSAYLGVDLSAAALEEAASWLASIPNTTLLQADLLEALEQESPKAPPHHIIFSGFAIHHLTTEAKQRFFHAAATHLTNDGIFILVDIVRGPGQTRAEYLQSYITFMQTRWTDLSPAQFQEAQTHIESFDYPETLEDLTTMARTAGFQTIQPISQHGHHHILVFSKS